MMSCDHIDTHFLHIPIQQVIVLINKTVDTISYITSVVTQPKLLAVDKNLRTHNDKNTPHIAS